MGNRLHWKTRVTAWKDRCALGKIEGNARTPETVSFEQQRVCKEIPSTTVESGCTRPLRSPQRTGFAALDLVANIS
uniref:hypothetical protein n=1 Tax=Nocardia suismassiliense TaxID=2077092 RepID=UPI003F4970F1